MFGKRISHHEFHQAEAHYSKLYGIGNCRCRQLHAGNLLDSILYGSPRIPSSGQYFVPGQQECNSFGEEWKSFKQYLVFSLLPIVSIRAMYHCKPTRDKELKPSRGKSTIYHLVPSKEKGWHHRSVLGEVT
jgi:hypothetical protein